MPRRWLLAAVLVSATLMAGCSNANPTGAGGSFATVAPGNETSRPAPAAPLNSRQCADVNDANVDLLVGSDNDAARSAANTLETRNPPPSVQNAIEHFVRAGGARFDDPQYPRNYKVLDDWLKQLCPTQ